ncbi:MAG: Serine/threonine protein kinase, partial [Verrucomicrobiaceae bacterium]|nr:Serine/threonine protein kinase [Verrucomicrobiaceae bacterium]
HVLWLLLMTGLLLASAYGFITLKRAMTAEGTIETNLASTKTEVNTRDQKIGGLTSELKQTQEAKKATDSNLQRAQAMVDQLVTQLMQLPQGNNLEIAFSKQQLSDAATFVADGLPAMEKNPAMAPERARAYGNLGMIALKQRRTADAAQYLDKARNELHLLLSRDPGSPHASLYHQWLGRYCLLLANMRSARGEGVTAMTLLKEATANLEPGMQTNPKDRNARYEAAQAWFNYGVRSRLEGNAEEGSKALERVSAALDEKQIGSQLMPEEAFLLARAEMERGLALRDAGKLQDSVTILIASVEKMATLVAGSSPRNQEQAIVTAEAYTELADVVGKAFTPKEAIDAHTEALKLIYELTRIDPDWNEAKYLLARNLGEIASLERDSGNPSEAYKKKADAIQQINEVVADDKDNRRYLFEQSKLVAEIAEIMGELGKPKEGIVKANQALSSLEELIQVLPEAMTAERKEWEIELALVYGIHAQLNDSAKLRDAARKSFATAEKRWTRLAEVDPDNEIVKRGVDWTRNKLEKLR